jgi:hypothetical protein
LEDRTQEIPEDEIKAILAARKPLLVAVEGEKGGRECRSIARPLDVYIVQGRISVYTNSYPVDPSALGR